MREIKYKGKDIFLAVLFAVISGLFLNGCSTTGKPRTEARENFNLEEVSISIFRPEQSKKIGESESFRLESQMGKENSRSEHFILQKQ